MVRLNIKNKLKWVRSHKWRSLLLLFITVIIGYFVYDKIALELNKRAFAQARAAIDTVYADIIKDVGQPDNSSQTSDCEEGYINAFDKIISCSVGTDFIYIVKGKQEADGITEKVDEIVNNYKDLLRPTSSPKSDIDINPAPGDPDTNSSINYYSGPRDLLCIIKFVYDTAQSTYLHPQKVQSGKIYYVTMNCSGNTKTHYY